MTPAGTVLPTLDGWRDIGARPLSWLEAFELSSQRDARLASTEEVRAQAIARAHLDAVLGLAVAYRKAAERMVYRERMEQRARERKAADREMAEAARELRRQLRRELCGSHHDRHPGAWMPQGWYVPQQRDNLGAAGLM